MQYTDLSEHELADRFDEVAADFRKLIKDNHLENTRVHMMEGHDRRREGKPLCDTPACHGGWAAIMYPEMFEDLEIRSSNLWACPKETLVFYEAGAYFLAKKLGFETIMMYECWADKYQNYWGSNNGGDMFGCPSAFGKKYSELILSDIADWYADVAKRLRGEL